jgi:hypothetical protein
VNVAATAAVVSECALSSSRYQDAFARSGLRSSTIQPRRRASPNLTCGFCARMAVSKPGAGKREVTPGATNSTPCEPRPVTGSYADGSSGSSVTSIAHELCTSPVSTTTSRIPSARIASRSRVRVGW